MWIMPTMVAEMSFPVMDLISHLSSQETFITVLDDEQQACPSGQ
jgi:hypothetical protein